MISIYKLSAPLHSTVYYLRECVTIKMQITDNRKKTRFLEKFNQKINNISK